MQSSQRPPGAQQGLRATSVRAPLDMRIQGPTSVRVKPSLDKELACALPILAYEFRPPPRREGTVIRSPQTVRPAHAFYAGASEPSMPRRAKESYSCLAVANAPPTCGSSIIQR